MRTFILCSLLVMMLSSASSGAGQPAQVGGAFADIYGAFAPLGVFHRSYADFLFYGTDVAIPEGLAAACEETGPLLGLLHIDLLTQTGSHVTDTLPRLARLRANLAAFCDVHSGTLIGISLLDSPDLAILKGASELGLFADIYELQNGMQFAFEAYLDGLTNEQAKWEFAVAFALKTVLDQEDLTKIEPGLRDILYGSEEATLPPPFVSQDIATAIMQLVEFVDIPLEASMVVEIRMLAQRIYEFVVDEL
ncbi:hypothetical protein ACFLSZ_04815 [Candidatus Bipolaricaulota bacterium]